MSAPEIPIGLPGPLLNVFGGSFIGNFLTALYVLGLRERYYRSRNADESLIGTLRGQ